MTIGAGGVLSTAEELSTFGSAFFTENPVLLSEQAKNAMRTSAEADPYDDGFGLGWDSVGDPDYDAAGVQVVHVNVPGRSKAAAHALSAARTAKRLHGLRANAGLS